MRPFLLVIFLLCVASVVSAQVGEDSTGLPSKDSIQTIDSTVTPDSLLTAFNPDSIYKRPRKDSGWKLDSAVSSSNEDINQLILKDHPYFGFSTPGLHIPSDLRHVQGKELIFYILVVLVLIYAFLRLAFPKYFNDLFRLFFRTTLKQRQIREQLMQTPLPSLLLNVYYVIIAGLYVSFVLQHYQLNPVHNFWLMFLYAALGLSTIYFIKFLGLKVTGWLFNMKEAANSYIFIVFVINKMLGLFLLPFVVLLAFTQGDIYPTALVVSYCMVGVFIVYRFILSYTAIRNEVKVNPFHFFLYLIAFEFAPLLLIYKALLLFFRISA